jgi:hypothetical protein
MRDFVEKLYVIIINFLEGSYYKSMSIGDVYRWVHVYSYAMNMIDWVFISIAAVVAFVIVIKCMKEEETH